MRVRNPLTLGSVAGLWVNLAGWTIPTLLWIPASMLAAVTVTVIAAFPTAHNILLIASRYRLACDAIFASTAASVPVAVLASTLLR